MKWFVFLCKQTVKHALDVKENIPKLQTDIAKGIFCHTMATMTLLCVVLSCFVVLFYFFYSFILYILQLLYMIYDLLHDYEDATSCIVVITIVFRFILCCETEWGVSIPAFNSTVYPNCFEKE